MPFEAAEAFEGPAELLAVTVNVYATPLFNPVMTWLVVDVPLWVSVPSLGLGVTV